MKLRLAAIYCLLVVIFCLLLVSAAYAPQSDVTATARDNGGHVQLRSGQLFEIVLADDSDETGCRWREEQERGSDDAVVHWLGSSDEPGREPPNGDGNGIYTGRYRAQQTGTVRIRLVESASAEEVCRRYAVDVTVGKHRVGDSIASSVEGVLYFMIKLVGAGLILGPIGLVLYRVSRLVYRLSKRR